MPVQAQERPSQSIIRYTSIHHPVMANGGMVASQNHIATDVGAAILRKGGNAVDAAVAVGFAMAVTYPQAGNIGGGGFMVIHLAEENKSIAIDYREMAPAAAHRDMYLNEDGSVDLIFASNTPDDLYENIITKLQNHPHITSVLASQGGPACKAF